MNKISAKSIQMFVAGALSLMGFHSLIWLPYYIVFSQSIALAGGSIFSGLALLMGVAMLIGSERAIFWARIYLLLDIVSAIAMTCLSALSMPGAPHLSWWRSVSDLLTPAILIWLLVLSRSKHFQDEPVV
jgi:hypothetical protein